MKKRWLIGLLVVILVLAAGAGYYYYTTTLAASDTTTTAEAAMQTAVARRGDLEVMASGTGQVAAASEMALGFDQAGTLSELNVAVGDQVKRGDTLARLQTNNTQEEIAVTISDAELAVVQAQQALDNLTATADVSRTTAMNDIATYSQAVRDAQYTLENYTVPPFLQGVDTITAVDHAKAALDEAWAAFNPYRNFPENDVKREALLEKLNTAQTDYDSAVKLMGYEYALQVAQDNLEKARAEYEKYKNGPAESDLSLARATLANAQAKLDLAKKTESEVSLTAPFDGTVMSVSANVGETVSTTPFITLGDLQKPILNVYVDETDLDKVAVGYPANVVFDALPDKTFTGKVISVSPTLETVGNVNAIKVLVQLDPGGLTTQLPAGLSASVDIIAGQAKNAVLVPVEALRKLDENEYAVFVVVDGQPELRVVDVGLTDVTSAEIKSGLVAGETVSTGIVQSK
jgi:HlyD family secretion protein